MAENDIYVTSPLMPSLERFQEALRDIWYSKWLTNGGKYSVELEKALAQYLGVWHLSLFSNGTLPLLTALHLFCGGVGVGVSEGVGVGMGGAVGVGVGVGAGAGAGVGVGEGAGVGVGEGGANGVGVKEVITTPFTFVATVNAIRRSGFTPVFADVCATDGTLNVGACEAAIGKNTVAVLPVHVYGNVCNVSGFERLSSKYGIKVIYDAAHAFGVTIGGRSVLEYGDASTLSFHATKVYNTIEGGALVVRSAEAKRRVDLLRNFGIASETEIVCDGLNGKIDEVRAAYGLLNLQHISEAILRRRYIVEQYRDGLCGIRGIWFFEPQFGVESNYSYFSIFINEWEYGLSRDQLYEKLKGCGVFARRYFYPLVSNLPMYRNLPSARKENLPVANMLANSVLCLPLYPELSSSSVSRIIRIISDRK